MTLETTIRVGGIHDAPRIAAVQVASWRTTYPGIVSQTYIDQLSVEGRTHAWERILRGETTVIGHVVVAETTSGALVGFASGGAIREPQLGFDAELFAIYLLQNEQRRGVGRRLLAHWAAEQSARGFHAAMVRVLKGNPACGFYERLGARWLEDGMLTIDGQPYPEVVYGWDDLRALWA